MPGLSGLEVITYTLNLLSPTLTNPYYWIGRPVSTLDNPNSILYIPFLFPIDFRSRHHRCISTLICRCRGTMPVWRLLILPTATL